MECNLFLPWYSWKNAHLGLKNNHSLSKISTEDKGLTTPWVLHIHWTMADPPCKTQQTHKSVFPHMISDMNQLPIVMSCSVEIFKTAVSSSKYSFMKHVNNFNFFQLSYATCDIIFLQGSYHSKLLIFLTAIENSLSVTCGRLFSPVSSTNKADCHDITEILLIVA
jgi:hypothetical protein